MPLPDPTRFLAELFSALEPTPGILDHLYVDHLCYRVERVEDYEKLRDELLAAGNKLLVEGIIGGRRISTFRMQEAFTFKGRRIPLLELPEPKKGSPYSEGYEHIEFVTDRPLAQFINWLTDTLGISPNDLDGSGMSKARNADIRLRLANGTSVKFHEQDLATVIAEELAE